MAICSETHILSTANNPNETAACDDTNTARYILDCRPYTALPKDLKKGGISSFRFFFVWLSSAVLEQLSRRKTNKSAGEGMRNLRGVVK
jgi:hypothetical protein